MSREERGREWERGKEEQEQEEEEGLEEGREGWKVTMSHLHCFRHRRLHQTEVRQGREEELKQAKPRELH